MANKEELLMQAQANSPAWTLQQATDMSTQQFVDWCQLVEERTGMVLNEQRRSFLQVNLNSRMLELGLSDYSDYYQRVLSGPQAVVEWNCLLDRLTVKETLFFRHPPSFQHVGNHLADLLRQDKKDQPLSLLSVGCSTGEEAWSLAITAAEAISETKSQRSFALTAIDISARALRTARQGTYAAQQLACVDEKLLEKYFQRQQDGQLQVRHELAGRMCFGRFNALDIAGVPMNNMDVIFCQNLLIYFRRWQRREILNHLAGKLAPGGLLIIGLGEITGWSHPELRLVNNKQILAFTRVGR